MSSDAFTTVRGVQGKVDKTSRANHVSLVFAGFRQDNPDLLAISLEKMSDGMGVGFGGILGCRYVAISPSRSITGQEPSASNTTSPVRLLG